MALKLMYITNRSTVAQIADKYGVDRIWVDLETRGKYERQSNINSVKSNHVMSDISTVKAVLTNSQLMVRVNPLFGNSKKEIDEAISRGADLIMLPMFHTADDAQRFVDLVGGRAKTMLLVETKLAEQNIDEIASVFGVDEIHIGLNDLHLEYGMDFMFELLANGQVEALTKKIAAHGIPYGFGGIARLDEGLLPGRHVIAEHYRLGSNMVILSRSFFDSWLDCNQEEIERVFYYGMGEIRDYEQRLLNKDKMFFTQNQHIVADEVDKIVKSLLIKKEKSFEDNRPAIKVEQLDYTTLTLLAERYGESYYILNSDLFRQNYAELTEAFSSIYPSFKIAYSYKTNYIPKLCKIVDELGGYAEVVSDMECEIAKASGVKPEKIIFNGPYKKPDAVERLLLQGGTVNIDSLVELDNIGHVADTHPDVTLNVGIRVNFDVSDNVVSRFGFDVDSEDFQQVLAFVKSRVNIHLIGMHCHYASRRLDSWKPRAKGMLALLDKLGLQPEHIDLGGGLYGKMNDSLKAQFDTPIPTYNQYAIEAASPFAEHYDKSEYKPLLLVEPGTALVGDVMRFAAKVKSIKTVRGKPIATILGSIYNINPTLNKKNPPLTVVHGNGQTAEYIDLDFGGFTCIESDYVYKGYNGTLAVDDYAVFENAGSYSVVLKPPFILPNFAVLDIAGGKAELIKRSETFYDLFCTYKF